ncbi:MAG TPA: ATP-binding protein [Labilithrix sp.]|nr:ATP-binding protein [Labilithrix sp.]
MDSKMLGLSLRALVEELPFDVWIRDVDDRMVFANAALRRRWPGVMDRTVEAAEVQSSVAETWRANNARALAGESVKDEVIYVLDGERQAFLGVVAPIHGESGAVCGTVGINVDVTGERRAQAEAAKLGQLLRTVFTTATVAIGIRAIRGDDLVYVEDNPRAAALMGSTPDGLRGVTDRELGVAPEQTRASIERFRMARATGAPVSLELTYPSAGGTPRTLVGRAVALDDPEEERYVFVAEDVTELRLLQSSLVRVDRLASLGSLSASIGHELASSTAVAMGQVELAMKLAERGVGPEALVGGLREARSALARTTEVLRDMRALAVGADLGSEKAEVNRAVDDVKRLLSDMLDRFVTLHEARDCEAKVQMSHSRLVQILLNVVRNAIEALAPERGNLWLSVTSPSPGHVRIELADDGRGLDPALAGRLFEPFASTKPAGTGLGLYVSRLLTTRAGGTIEATPREGGGTRLRIELPAAT